MTDRTTDSAEPYRPSLNTDHLRPGLLLAGTQVMISLVAAVLATSGVLT